MDLTLTIYFQKRLFIPSCYGEIRHLTRAILDALALAAELELCFLWLCFLASAAPCNSIRAIRGQPTADFKCKVGSFQLHIHRRKRGFDMHTRREESEGLYMVRNTGIPGFSSNVPTDRLRFCSPARNFEQL
jgi:hypothetical protein